MLFLGPLTYVKAVNASDEMLQHLLGLILSIKIPVSALLEVTRARIKEEATAEPHVIRQFLETRAASKEAFLALAAGDILSARAVADLLQMSAADVHRAKDEGRILAYRQLGRRSCCFPVFQFRGRAVAPWVIELVQIVGNGFAALHFLTTERKSLSGKNYLSHIQYMDTKAEKMLQHARRLYP